MLRLYLARVGEPLVAVQQQFLALGEPVLVPGVGRELRQFADTTRDPTELARKRCMRAELSTGLLAGVS